MNKKSYKVLFWIALIAAIVSFVGFAMAMYNYNEICMMFNDLTVATNTATELLNYYNGEEYTKISELICF